MSAREDGGPAFPSIALRDPATGSVIGEASQGLTIRDWFAGMALEGLLAKYNIGSGESLVVARWAYDLADAMLVARAQEKS